MCRLYKTENAIVVQAREEVLDSLAKLVVENGGLALRFTPTEIYLGSEAVVHPRPKGSSEETQASAGEQALPFLFYGDGIRGLRIPLGCPREEMLALFDALRAAGGGALAHEDLATMLWQANLKHIQLDTVPLEQTIYLSSGSSVGTSDASARVHTYAWSPGGAEIHAAMGQVAGGQGLHRDTFDDWELAETYVDVAQAYAHLLPTMDYSRAHFRSAWEEESGSDWTAEAPRVLREIQALGDDEDARAATTHAVVSWIGGALHRTALVEAQMAIELLAEFDPDRSRSAAELGAILRQLDIRQLAEYLDEADPEEQARFAAVAVGLGRPAIDLAVGVMTTATRSRARAAACTALCYLCADEPQLLEPHLGDPREEAVLHIVFVLGQIGGPGVVNLLRLAAQNPDPRVRKQVVQSLGAVPASARIPQLLQELDSEDPQILIATLHMLAREKNPRVARALIDRIDLPDFESRNEEVRRAIFSTLAEVADDDSVPALVGLLNKGGWLARRTFSRTAVARVLRRMDTAGAEAALQAGLRSRNGAVRVACQEAMEALGQP